MTAQEIKVMREGLDVYRCALHTVSEQRKEAQAKLTEVTYMGSYWYMRYHDTRVGLTSARLDILSLEAMVQALQKQLDNKGPDITFTNDDLDVV